MRLLALGGAERYRRFARAWIGWVEPLVTADAAPVLASLSDAQRGVLRAVADYETKDPGPSLAAVLTVLSDHSPDCPSIDTLPEHSNKWVTEASAADVLQALLHPEVRRQRGTLTPRARGRLERLISKLTASSSADHRIAGERAASDLAVLFGGNLPEATR